MPSSTPASLCSTFTGLRLRGRRRGYSTTRVSDDSGTDKLREFEAKSLPDVYCVPPLFLSSHSLSSCPPSHLHQKVQNETNTEKRTIADREIAFCLLILFRPRRKRKYMTRKSSICIRRREIVRKVSRGTRVFSPQLIKSFPLT